VDFDVEIAIKVCRQASSEDALLLAKKHGMHDWYLKIQIEDRGMYREALEYISSLEFEDVSKIENNQFVCDSTMYLCAEITLQNFLILYTSESFQIALSEVEAVIL
jgi:hypothetical protein